MMLLFIVLDSPWLATFSFEQYYSSSVMSSFSIIAEFFFCCTNEKFKLSSEAIFFPSSNLTALYEMGTKSSIL